MEKLNERIIANASQLKQAIERKVEVVGMSGTLKSVSFLLSCDTRFAY